MKCNNCNFNLVPDSKFCNNCGEKIIEKVSEEKPVEIGKFLTYIFIPFFCVIALSVYASYANSKEVTPPPVNVASTNIFDGLTVVKDKEEVKEEVVPVVEKPKVVTAPVKQVSSNPYLQNYEWAKDKEDIICQRYYDAQRETGMYQPDFFNAMVQSGQGDNSQWDRIKYLAPLEEGCNKAKSIVAKYFKLYCQANNYQDVRCVDAVNTKTKCVRTGNVTNCNTY